MTDEYFYLPVSFYNPPGLQLPTKGEIQDNTQHPQLNSEDYHHRIYNEYTKPSVFLPFYCFLDCTDDLFIAGTNNFTAAIKDSSLLGAKDFNVIANQDASRMLFQKAELHNLTCAKFLEPDTILTTTSNHQMQLWSTKVPDEGLQKFSSHPTGGSVKGITKLANTHKLVLANEHDLQILDYGLYEVHREKYFEKAHSKEITGVSAHPTDSTMFATCAADKNCVQWDLASRDRIASYICKKYENQLTSVYWTTQAENQELVMVGDEIGNLLTLDPRSPEQFLNKIRVSNRSIRKIIFNGTKQFAVISRSNKAHILEIDDSGEPKVVQTHIAPYIIYDFCWDRKDSRKFYVVGEHRYASTGKILA